MTVEEQTKEEPKPKVDKKEAEAKQKLLDEKLKRIDIAQAAMSKEFGKGILFRYDSDQKYEWPSISTGALTLDLALGIGGVPRGRIIEIYGPEASGKSTLCMTIVAQAQKEGGICAYIDSEHAMDPKYAQALGLQFEKLLVSQPDYGEQALDIVEQLARTGAVDVIVVDSVASLTPKAEIDGTMHDNSMGQQARMMSQHMRKINGVASQTNTCLIFVNQLREKIGIMFGNPETTPGGRALKFYSSVRMDIRRKEDVKIGTEKIGHTAKVVVRKNRMAPPFREAEFDILWGRGINNFGCVLDLAVERDLLVKSGAWYKTHDDMPIGQGRTNAFEYLANDLDLYEQLKEEILNG